MFDELSIYIHYPFCKSKCPYCDFNSHVVQKVDHAEFLRSYEKELQFFADKISTRRVKTIFFGGGTPSLMPISLVEGILSKIYQLFEVDKKVEITLEANPTSFESEKFKDFKKAGINRLSIGIQALNDEDLKFLGREHSAQEAISTIETAQNIFDNFSFDLIYARPKQTLDSWQKELEKAINFGTKHLSLYQLTIEKGTKFYSQFKNHEFQMPDEELSAKFYELTAQITSKEGFLDYEISNYAKQNYESKHNLAYWQGDDYIGIGAGAHSRVYFGGEKNRREIMMIHNPKNWLKTAINQGAGIQKNGKISSQDLLEELILMGLRLQKGIDNSVFKKHFDKNIDEIFDLNHLQKMQKQGLVLFKNNVIKVNDDKRILSNLIIEKVCRAAIM